jgi:hypothetical protein
VSGVSSVAVEVHRHGTSEWEQLPVTASGDIYGALIDDERLPAGTYDLRTRAVDAAGNERTATTDSAGVVATIELPVRRARPCASARYSARPSAAARPGHQDRIRFFGDAPWPADGAGWQPGPRH